ncbi:hypothetical protein BLNAU_22865 [Blattamonas nauphoetae]|uniref:Uncharacterized protein n=1 Tax=Blattamonas nauphoetae TaxID=2049346 RepID=A0ABQ9WRT6_9EUKA|nr:hypothetical protein BLNAU_22865 [Blattamonas nauphoetae]
MSFRIPLVDDDVIIDEAGTIRITCFGDNGRIPPTWCQSVQKALIEGETHQKMKDVKNHMKFVQILGMYASGASQDASDISFLQAPCFRDTLVRLQTKFQDRANSSSRHPHPVAVMEEESPSIGFSTHSPQLFKQRPAGQSIGTQGVASEGDSYHPSTCTPLSSEESQSDSVDSHQNSTAQMSLQTRLPSSGSSDSISIELSSQETLLWDDRLPRNDYEEAMSVLEILHHIQSAAPQLDNPTPPDIFMFDPPRLEGNEIDLHERFSVAIFDQDVQSLLASLERCRSVCKTVSPTECIDDLPLFVDMLIMFLNSHTDLITQSASRFLFFLFDFIDFDVFINEHWHTLKTAFKDGNEASRFVLLRTIVLLFKNIVRYRSQVASLLDEFDWAGLIASDLEDEGLFVQTVLVLNYIFMYHAGGLSSKCQVASLYRSFEEIQNATARIMPILQREFQEHEYRPDDPLITYCLIQSFHLCLQLPQDLVDFVSAFPHLLDSSTPTPVHPSLVLSHTSMTVNRLKQQAVIAQLIFERTLRSKPSLFFSEGSPRTIHQFRTHALTPLVGLHSLFIRGAHIKPMEFDAHDFLETVPHFSDGPDVWYWDQFRLYSFFPPPLVLQVFSRSLVHSPSIVLSESQLFRIFIPLLRACAPFGECCSFSSLAAYLIRPGPIGGLGQDGPHQALTILHTILSLHWFSLPLSFDSPFLLHPHLHTVWLETEDTINPWDKPPDWEKFLSSLIIETFSSSRDLDNESLMLAIAIGKFYPILRRHSASVFSRCGLTRHLFRFLLSPIPVTVSLALAFLTRVVMESDVRWKMEMLRLGVIDCVVMAILRSSFLEDYEHGVTLIGDLLRTVRHDAQESRMTQINLGDIV